MKPPVDHDPRADPGRDHQVDHVRHPAAGPERDLRERPQVRVVVDRDLEVEPARQLVQRVQPLPAGQDHRRADGAVPRDRPRERDADSDDAFALDPGLREHDLDELGGRVESLLGRPVDVEVLPLLGEHGRRQVRDRDAEVVVVEMDPDHRADRGIQTKERRRAASPVDLGERLLDDEPSCLEVVHERGDGGAGEPRVPCDVAAAGGPPLPQGIDHTQPIQLTQSLQRSRSRHRPGVCSFPAVLSRACDKSAGYYPDMRRSAYVLPASRFRRAFRRFGLGQLPRRQARRPIPPRRIHGAHAPRPTRRARVCSLHARRVHAPPGVSLHERLLLPRALRARDDPLREAQRRPCRRPSGIALCLAATAARHRHASPSSGPRLGGHWSYQASPRIRTTYWASAGPTDSRKLVVGVVAVPLGQGLAERPRPRARDRRALVLRTDDRAPAAKHGRQLDDARPQAGRAPLHRGHRAAAPGRDDPDRDEREPGGRRLPRRRDPRASLPASLAHHASGRVQGALRAPRHAHGTPRERRRRPACRDRRPALRAQGGAGRHRS